MSWRGTFRVCRRNGQSSVMSQRPGGAEGAGGAEGRRRSIPLGVKASVPSVLGGRGPAAAGSHRGGLLRPDASVKQRGGGCQQGDGGRDGEQAAGAVADGGAGDGGAGGAH